MSNPDFLNSPKSAAAPKDPFPSPAQKTGTSNVPGGEREGFENRPQPSGGNEADPKSIPSGPGGKYPFSPMKAPPMPAKFSK